MKNPKGIFPDDDSLNGGFVTTPRPARDGSEIAAGYNECIKGSKAIIGLIYW
jgi:hypothetical protein